MEESPVIIAENITKSYGNLTVLHNINLRVAKGEIVAVTGASGAGKTTLLQILGSLDKADKGKVILNGTDILSLKGNRLAAFRNNHLGFVFQFHHLLPEFTALENVCIPAFIRGESKQEAEKRAMEYLDFLNIRERAEHKPSELSGGEAQRVAIARALINNPDIVFADEPSGNLDAENSLELHELFFRLREHFGQTFIIVTHDPVLAGKSDRIVKLKDGVIVE
jgi:lipoprotein-releasing system ATP-binding protein